MRRRWSGPGLRLGMAQDSRFLGKRGPMTFMNRSGARRFTFSMPQLHHGCRDPSHRRARPSCTSVSPMDRPRRVTVRSFRQYPSSSRAPLTSENVPALSNSRNRYLAASPFCRSASHRGGLSSGASMSAILIFTPSSQKVSPSTTQVMRRPSPHKGNVAATVSSRGLVVGDRS